MFRYKKPVSAEHIWFAYIDPTDEMCDTNKIPANAERIRIVAYDDIPVFGLFYQHDLSAVSPHEILYAMGEGRITFPTDRDKEVFCNVLSDYLVRYDKISSILDKASKVGLIALGAAAVIGTVGASAYFALRNKK